MIRPGALVRGTDWENTHKVLTAKQGIWKLAAEMREGIVFYLNGARHEVTGEKAGWMLADFLRYELGLVGTKIVCAEGDCGACTVLKYSPLGNRSFLPINSCIATVAQMDGSSLVTVDRLASDGKLSPIQEAMVRCHGSQCGFCTPGFVMALAGLVEKKLEARETVIGKQEAKNALTGNLCRCTGYEPILEAAEAIPLNRCSTVKSRFWSQAQERDLRKVFSEPVLFEGRQFSFFAPKHLREAVTFLKKNKDARLLAAGTDLGVIHNKRKLRMEKVVSLHLISELYKILKIQSRLKVGARVTLSQLRVGIRESIPELARFIDLFASPQIKNVATLMGNVCNASPIADLPPFLLSTNAIVHTLGPLGKRKIELDWFYLSYRKTALRPGEVAVALEFDVPSKSESLSLYKVSRRKDLDISTVNAAFRVKWRGRIMEDPKIALGGMAATPVRLRKTEKLLSGQELSSSLLARALQIFHSELAPISDLRGSAAFRRIVSENLFQQFFREHSHG